MPSIDENMQLWNSSHEWCLDGDEWDNQAAHCNIPYGEWKQSIVEAFIYSNIDENSHALEIAPGHGRWSEFLIKRAKRVMLVDLSPNCIEFCKERFSEFDNVDYFVNNGKSLDFVSNNSIDFVWSYDSFVHMEKDVIESYFAEISRALRPKGKAIIHHAGRRNAALRLQFMRKLGKRMAFHYDVISFDDKRGNWGGRSNISRELIAKVAKKYGLEVEDQVDTWGENYEYNMKLFKDYMTILIKP